MDKVVSFINGNENEEGACFVHCQAGISRSVSYILAYLMKIQKMNLKEAFLLVKSKSPKAGPNQGYWKELMALETSITKKACSFNLQDYYAQTLADMGFDLEKARKILKEVDGIFDLALSRLLV